MKKYIILILILFLGISGIAFAQNVKTQKGNLAIKTGKLAINTKDSSLVGYWKLNETTGTLTADSSGNGNTGTLLPAGSEPVWTSGKVNGALSFDGVDDYVVHPDIAFTINQPWTFSMWQKMPSGSNQNWAGFIGKTIASTDGGYWFYHGGGILKWYQDYYESKAYIWISGLSLGNQIPYDEWTQITAVNEPVNSVSTKVTVYVDGGKYKVSTTFPWSPRPGLKFTFKWIGLGDNSRFFNGLIDDVRIYNRALGAEEILSIYNAQK